ncbi:carbohydrate ABC transporter permease [Microbacterium oxydans]|jgi:alpha-glucoside transport system permease protein|uniref:carbohydrate ABC transporter permease n=1 Tax=Microbacterium oxydans TaxID=82380 RepID=UPI00226B3743|nr:sugar ABC transporter permease [Microbacterium oxydans]WAA65258.1 sugar ABC transporter permease [Microbacterium oxydans]
MSDFFKWVAGMPPLVQVLVVVLAFGVVVGIVIFLLEIAPRAGRLYTGIRLAACIVVPLLVFIALGSVWWAAAVAAVLGGLFFWLDFRSRQGAGYMFQLVGFLAPAMVLLAIGLVYPSIATIIQSFMNSRGNRFVGLENFVWIFATPKGISTVANTIVWVLVAPIVSTAIGLAYAVFIDRSRGEKVFKSLVFMPMAISFVGASIIFRFIYTARPADQPQIGLLNQIVVWFGGQPVDFLAVQPWNNLFLIVVLIWVQTGFAMVILSAAIKGVPAELNEAASLDGANAWQRFRSVTIPGIRPALIVVMTTISIASLKVFDIVRTMTAGANNTSVLANEMYSQFKGFEAGRSAALAVVLFILVVPIVVYNARNLAKQREMS